MSSNLADRTSRVGRFGLASLVLIFLVSCTDSHPCALVAPQDRQHCFAGGVVTIGHELLPRPSSVQVGFTRMPENDWQKREVDLKPFLIDRYEATWGDYRHCVERGACGRVGLDRLPYTRAAYDNPASSALPADLLTWDEAFTYCLFRGGRLPTEAEWERAAGGPSHHDYPWGNEPPPENLLEMPISYTQYRTPQPVGSTPTDVTNEGVHDMFGSVQEWVSDFYDPHFYERGSTADARGPRQPVYLNERHPYGAGNWRGSAGDRVVRGKRSSPVGGVEWPAERGDPVWFRGHASPLSGAGVRCARDTAPVARTSSTQATPTYRSPQWREVEPTDPAAQP